MCFTSFLCFVKYNFCLFCMYFKSCIKLIIYYNNFELENMEQVNEFI